MLSYIVHAWYLMSFLMICSIRCGCEEGVLDLEFSLSILYVSLQLVHRLLNIASTTNIRLKFDRPVHMMTHETLTNT